MNKDKSFELTSLAVNYIMCTAVVLTMILYGVHLVISMFHYWFG